MKQLTVLPILFWVIACSDGTVTAPSSSGRAPLVVESTQAPVLRLSSQSLDDAAAATKLAKLSAILGNELTADQLKPTYRKSATAQDPGIRLDVQLGETTLFGRYESQDDSVEVYDTEAFNMAPSTSDLSAKKASAVYAGVVAGLVDRGIVSATRILLANTEVHEIHASQGDRDGLHRDWIDEYACFTPLTIDGVRVGTNSKEFGVWATIHRSGKVRRVEITGAALASGAASAGTTIKTIARSGPRADVERAIKAEMGEATVKPLGLRLVMPDDMTDKSQDVIPRELFRVVPTFVSSETGETVQSKAFVASYPTNESEGPLTISPRPGSHGPVAGDQKPTGK